MPETDPDDRSRLEDEVERPRARGRPWMVLPALVLATAGAFVAPEAWPEGDGRLEVSYRGATALDAAVPVGSVDEVVLDGQGAGVAVSMELPGGVPVDAPVEATVAVSRGGAAIRPVLGDVEVTLVLPDGSRELIPVLNRDDEGRLLASRRPPVDAAPVLGLLGLVVILWVTEAFPLFVTSLAIPVVLVVAGVADADAALAPFFDPIIVLFFGGFLMAQAMRRVELDRLAAISIVARAGRGPVLLFLALMGVAAFMSMWMSNTAAVAVMIPIAMAVTTPLDSPGYRKAVVLGIAYASTIGGVGSPIGTPANPLAIEFLGSFVGRTISFVEWFAFGVPMVALFLPVMAWYLWRRVGVHVERERFVEARRIAARELAAVGRPTKDQVTVLGVFVAVVSVWLTQSWHGLNTGIVALGGAVALTVLGKIVPGDLRRISWESLLTFGGGLTLGVFLVGSGTSDWVATRMTSLVGVPWVVSLLAVAGLTLVMTAVASNTASAAMLVPLAIPLAGVLGVDPVVMVVVVAIASSIDFALVIGTPPTMLAYATGQYTAAEIFRTGIVLDLIGIVLLVFGVVGIWRLFGLV